MSAPETFDVYLESARLLSPNTRELVFRRREGAAFTFLPGQWINLVLPLPDGELQAFLFNRIRSRWIRMLCDRGHACYWGRGSSYLHALPEGSIVRAIGPHGFFSRDPDDVAPALFVGTGTGVAPLRSMIHAAIRARSIAPMWLLFGARSEEDILYQSELEAIAASNPLFRYEVTLSRAGASWTGRRGYVQTHVPALILALRAFQPARTGFEPHVYVCGLDRMVSAVRDLCRKELGLDRKHVHQERYD